MTPHTGLSSTYPPGPTVQEGQNYALQGKYFYNNIEIVCITCPHSLKMGIWMGAMKSFGRTPQAPMS